MCLESLCIFVRAKFLKSHRAPWVADAVRVLYCRYTYSTVVTFVNKSCRLQTGAIVSVGVREQTPDAANLQAYCTCCTGLVPGG